MSTFFPTDGPMLSKAAAEAILAAAKKRRCDLIFMPPTDGAACGANRSSQRDAKVRHRAQSPSRPQGP
jgi:hypothetical protein